MLDNNHIQNIIESLRSQEPHALDDFLSNVAPSLHQYGLRMCRNTEDAQDVVQDSLIAAMNSIDGFRGQASVSSWLYTIARSFCIKKRRQRKFAPKKLEPLHDIGSDLTDTGIGADNVVHRYQFEKALGRALDGMEENQKEVFLLRDMEGLSAKEVAETLNISESATKSRLHRARENVRIGMKPWFDNSFETTSLTSTTSTQHSVECSRSKDISIVFSQFLEGELNPTICNKLKTHVENCSDCKPKCECLKATLKFCSETAKGEPMSPEILSQLRKTVENCKTL